MKAKKKHINLSRKRAIELIELLKKRAEELNEDTRIPKQITRLAVFGSFINSTKEKLGDLDILVELKLKNGYTYENVTYFFDIYGDELDLKEAGEARLFACYNYIFKNLKKNSKALSLHDYTELPYLKDQTHQIFYEKTI